MGVPEGRKKALRWIALLATALVLAVAAPLALAAIQIQNPKAQPLDTKQAGAPTRFETKITLGGTEHIKDLTTETPRGFGANIQNPTCTTADFNADTCPADTQIASTSVNLSLEPTPGVFVPTDPVSGRVYFLEPAPPGVSPRLGIILDTPTGKQRQIGEATIDSQSGTLKNTIRNFPRDSNGDGSGIPIRINSLDVILRANFAKNPQECIPATTNFYVTSYEDPNTQTRSSDTYTPTGCSSGGGGGGGHRVKCDGRRATKVGNNHANHINGTAKADVIFAGGGNDVVRGLKGNDVVCGGGGKDKLIGGPGKDTLLGGPGPDTLVGGPGKDHPTQ